MVGPFAVKLGEWRAGGTDVNGAKIASLESNESTGMKVLSKIIMTDRIRYTVGKIFATAREFGDG